MSAEGRHQDLKVSFDLNDPVSEIELVKDIVAMMNAGGGKIIFGRNETDIPGIDPTLIPQLDSARVADRVERFIIPSKVNLSHYVESLDNGNILITLNIPASDYPIVMSRDGTWSGFQSSRDRPIFRKGDIWTRHGSRNERVTYEDLRLWIDIAMRSERQTIMERLTTYVNLPEGTTLQPVAASGMPIDSPTRLIESALQRRDRDQGHLLSSDDLLWIFRQRETIQLSEDALALLLASSLRRSATLYWWLSQREAERDLIVAELEAVFGASDRDRSDAAASIIELAAQYASDEELSSILSRLDQSRYQHFREAASGWQNRNDALERLTLRITSASHEGRNLLEYSVEELEQLANILADQIVEKSSAARSRKLSTISRVIWAKSTARGRELLEDQGA